ncbi:hypothetical protein [Wolbachia endosymbiont of Dactylopius coccus]
MNCIVNDVIQFSRHLSSLLFLSSQCVTLGSRLDTELVRACPQTTKFRHIPSLTSIYS